MVIFLDTIQKNLKFILKNMEDLPQYKSIDHIGTDINRKKQIYFGRKKFDDYSYINNNPHGQLISLPIDSDNNLKKYKSFINKKEIEIESNMDRYRKYMINSNKNPNLRTSLSTGNFIINKNTLNTPKNIYNSPYIYTAESSRNSTDITNLDYYTKKINEDYIKFKQAQKNYLQYNQEIVNKKNPLDIIRRENKCYYDYNEKDYNNDINNNINKNYNGRRRLDLGKSTLEHNPILNPIGNYNYCRYLTNKRNNINYKADL